MTQMFFDARWVGAHGIGRVATEIRTRLFSHETYCVPRWPTSPTNPCDPVIRGAELVARRKAVFYSPGFNAPAAARDRTIFTVHDLIHLRVPEETSTLKSQYYKQFVRPAIAKAFKVLTVSEYSRKDILEWSGAADHCVLNVGNGVDERFFTPVTPYQPGFPYFFYIGARKPHKNLDRLLEAYAASQAMREIRLLLSGPPDAALMTLASRLNISDRLVFAGHIPDSDLPSFYRGAVALVFPSTFEGFGLPAAEAMAAGTPVLAANTSCLPEVVGNAALMADPLSVEALREGLDELAFNTSLRIRLIKEGPERARKHSWDSVAAKVGSVLNELGATV